MTSIAPPSIDFTGRDFDGIDAALVAFIRATRPTEQTDLDSPSSLGRMLTQQVAYIGDLLSFVADRTAQEALLATATRYDSAHRAARSVGYVPRSTTGATAVLTAQILPANVVQQGAVIAKSAAFTAANGLRYETIAETTIAPGSTIARVTVREGRTFSETFVPTRAASQEVRSNNSIVEQDSWHVFVGDANDPGDEWRQVDNVLFELSPTNTYEVTFDGDGFLLVRFGDGNAGKIPDQTVTVVYRTANGVAGNAPINSLRGTLQARTSISLLTETVDFVNLEVATGGRDRESVDSLRISVPAFLRTVDKVVALRDYAEGLRTQAGIALAFADNPTAGFSGNIVRVHVWANESFDFTSIGASSGITTTATYLRYAQAPSSSAAVVQRYLAPRTMTTVHNIVLRPTVALLDLSFGSIAYDKINDRVKVHEGIVKAVIALFERSTGFVIRIAEIYEAVLAVPGVRHFQIESATFERTDPTNAAVTLITNHHRDPLANPGTQAIGDFLIVGSIGRAFYDDTYAYDNEIRYAFALEDSTVQAINLRTLDFDLV